MFFMIIGGSKAGKSRFAEQLAVKIRKGRLLYLATMIPVGEGEEGEACIQRHRAQRSGLDFITHEIPYGLTRIASQPDDLILLEDVPNLVGNYLFVEQDVRAEETVLREIGQMVARCGTFIAVSYAELEFQEEYDDATRDYIERVNEVTKRLCDAADVVVMLEHGVPRVLKGSLPEQ